VATAAFADVVVGDADPPVPLGLGDHRLERATVGLLDVRPPGELCLGLAQSVGERIAHALELLDAEHPRAADRADIPVDPLAGKGGREDLSQPKLQPCDLRPEVVTDASLADPGNRSNDTGLSEPGIAPLVLEYRWHGRSSLPLQYAPGEPDRLLDCDVGDTLDLKRAQERALAAGHHATSRRGRPD
jgi:hypothetical protein